jgi:hypothetical protein
MIVLLGRSETIIQASAPDLPIEKGRPGAALRRQRANRVMHRRHSPLQPSG